MKTVQYSSLKWVRLNLFLVASLVVFLAGCAGSGNPPDVVILRLTAEHFKVNGVPNCQAGTGGKVVITGVPLADNTCAMNTTKDSTGKTISDTTKDFFIPIGSVITLTAVPTSPTDQFKGYKGDCTGTSLICTLKMDGHKKVSAAFCELIH